MYALVCYSCVTNLTQLKILVYSDDSNMLDFTSLVIKPLLNTILWHLTILSIQNSSGTRSQRAGGKKRVEMKWCNLFLKCVNFVLKQLNGQSCSGKKKHMSRIKQPIYAIKLEILKQNNTAVIARHKYRTIVTNRKRITRSNACSGQRLKIVACSENLRLIK